MFLALLIYPEVQKRAQNEADLILCGRLPTLEDVQEIPYLSALVQEVLRWQPVTPLGKCFYRTWTCVWSHFSKQSKVYHTLHQKLTFTTDISFPKALSSLEIPGESTSMC